MSLSIAAARRSARGRAALKASSREEGVPVTKKQQEIWAGILLTGLIAGLLLGGLVLLRLTGN